jgi:hypothetical protein
MFELKFNGEFVLSCCIFCLLHAGLLLGLLFNSEEEAAYSPNFNELYGMSTSVST